MIYRFSRCQMPIQGPALLPNLLRQCKPGSPWPASTYNNPHRHLIPRRRSSYFDIRSRHFNVNFCPAITGADALDLELAFPHMAHASDLSVHDWRYIGVELLTICFVGTPLTICPSLLDFGLT
jgi:hypothetical protein